MFCKSIPHRSIKINFRSVTNLLSVVQPKSSFIMHCYYLVELSKMGYNVAFFICGRQNLVNDYSLRPKLLVILTFLDTTFLLCIKIYIMSRSIAKSMYLEKRKRLIIWDAESILIYRIKQEIMIENIFCKSANENFLQDK